MLEWTMHRLQRWKRNYQLDITEQDTGYSSSISSRWCSDFNHFRMLSQQLQTKTTHRESTEEHASTTILTTKWLAQRATPQYVGCEHPGRRVLGKWKMETSDGATTGMAAYRALRVISMMAWEWRSWILLHYLALWAWFIGAGIGYNRPL